MPELVNSEAVIHFDLVGEGETLVLLPGFASGAWSWKHQVPDLSKHFRVITFDPRGVGRSTIRKGAVASIEKIAADTLGILDISDIEKAHVLGISFGGFVAQHIAIHAPDRVARLILACTSAGGPSHVPPTPAVLAAFGSSTPSGEKARHPLSHAFTPNFVYASGHVVDDFCSDCDSNPVDAGVHADQLAAAFSFDEVARVSQINVPTLVLSGDNDFIVPPANSLALAEAIPDATLRMIPDAGHMFFVESPEVFNRAVLEFLLNK